MNRQIANETINASPGARIQKLLKTALKDVPELLAGGQPLAKGYRDHPLTGEWRDYRDCHIRPDLLLVYRIYT